MERVQSFLRLKKADRKIKNAVSKGETSLSFGPTSLNLMMTDTCNAQCIMCGKDYNSCGTKEYLSYSDIKNIFQHLDMTRVVDVIYGGGGEPFLNPDLGKIASFTRTQYPVIQHTVISNMISWRQEIVEQLLDSGVHFLVSINASDPATYKQIVGVDGFNSVIKHVKELVHIRNSRKSQSKISISMILMRQNIGQLSEFIELACQLGVDDVKTLYVRVYPEQYRKKRSQLVEIAPEDSLFFMQEESDSLIRAAELFAEERNIPFEHEPIFSCHQSSERDCCEPWKSLFVNYNGDVYPCPASEILFKPKVDAGIYDSGNIITQHIDDFWNNDFWQDLRRTNIQSGRQDLIAECQCCGNGINWHGPKRKDAHILDWRQAE